MADWLLKGGVLSPGEVLESFQDLGCALPAQERQQTEVPPFLHYGQETVQETHHPEEVLDVEAVHPLVDLADLPHEARRASPGHQHGAEEGHLCLQDLDQLREHPQYPLPRQRNEEQWVDQILLPQIPRVSLRQP